MRRDDDGRPSVWTDPHDLRGEPEQGGREQEDKRELELPHRPSSGHILTPSRTEITTENAKLTGKADQQLSVIFVFSVVNRR
jgi:hypothetical protein